MNFGFTSSSSIENNPSLERKDSNRASASRYKGIMSRTRLTEEYLENLRLDIIRTHRKRNLRVLTRTSIFVSILLILLIFFL